MCTRHQILWMIRWAETCIGKMRIYAKLQTETLKGIDHSGVIILSMHGK